MKNHCFRLKLWLVYFFLKKLFINNNIYYKLFRCEKITNEGIKNLAKSI